MMFGVSLIPAITGCSDRAVTLSDITENSTEEEAQPGTDGVSLDGVTPDGSQVTDSGETPATITVYICGCVLNPGVYELPEGSRICDGLDAAGGFAEGADETRINLAGYLKDGDMVFFPKRGRRYPKAR